MNESKKVLKTITGVMDKFSNDGSIQEEFLTWKMSGSGKMKSYGYEADAAGYHFELTSYTTSYRAWQVATVYDKRGNKLAEKKFIIGSNFTSTEDAKKWCELYLREHTGE